jgi:pimeloyl-ACP methyl ester carboxylesterase
MSVAISRHYVEVSGRQVHYRTCGSGPAIVMLHDSPRSSRLHIGTMAALATRFTVFALDTPSYGNSDPLEGADCTIADFARALGQALSALGLDHAPLYATHTSAKIALAHAVLRPTALLLILDGLSIPEKLASPEFIAAYMRPFVPDDAGAYLAAEWSRTRDMLRYFPWFNATPARRIPVAAPSPEWMADYGIDLFAAGPHYADAYAAAMRYDPAADLRALQIPTIVAARSDDVLYSSLDKVPTTENPALTVERLTDDRAAWLDWLANRLAGAATLPAAPPPPRPTASAYAATTTGQMRLHRAGRQSAPTVMILSAPTTLQAHVWADALAATHATLVPELPGFDESDPLATPDADSIADLLASLIDAPIDLLGIGLAAPLAARLAARHPAKVATLIIDGAPPLDPALAAALVETICPAIAFDPHAGTHLHRIWHMLRDSELQWPWHDGSPGAARRRAPSIGARGLHRALNGVLKQPVHYGDAARAALAACTAAHWALVRVPTLILDHPGDPAHAESATIASLIPGARVIERTETPAAALASATTGVPA